MGCIEESSRQKRSAQLVIDHLHTEEQHLQQDLVRLTQELELVQTHLQKQQDVFEDLAVKHTNDVSALEV